MSSVAFYQEGTPYEYYGIQLTIPYLEPRPLAQIAEMTSLRVVSTPLSARKVTTYYIEQEKVDKLKESYSNHGLIEINSINDFKCLTEFLIESGEISLSEIKTITVSPSIGNPLYNEDNQLIDTLLNYLTENESKLVSLRSLSLHKYTGHLIIPTFVFKLKELIIGSATSLTIKSQSSLVTIKIDYVNNNLIIEKQKKLQELCMLYNEQGEKGAQIAIQPKLSSLQIYAPCSSNATIMIEKPQKELEKPVPLSNLLTMDHLLSVISINEKVYIGTALACIWLDDPTLFCIGSLLLILKNIIQEMQRIYSNEKGMMYIS